VRTRGVVSVAAAIGALGLLAGAGTAEASSSHTYSGSKVSFTGSGDTITVKDTRGDGYGVWVFVDDQTNGKNYALQCGSGTHKAPATVRCVRNYPEGHKMRFVTYLRGKGKEISQGQFTARA